MIEHDHWKRKNRGGIGKRKQHIAIVGYSHYGEPEEDFSGFTEWALDQFISGQPVGERFFPQIQSYFGYADDSDFWNRVHFFNYIPECFSKEKKFATGNGELLQRSNTRFLRILKAEKPDKVFLFSRKGWRRCPETLEEEKGNRCTPLKANNDDNWGTYVFDGHPVKVCGFRHPLFAKFEKMQPAVQEFLDMK